MDVRRLTHLARMAALLVARFALSLSLLKVGVMREDGTGRGRQPRFCTSGRPVEMVASAAAKPLVRGSGPDCC